MFETTRLRNQKLHGHMRLLLDRSVEHFVVIDVDHQKRGRERIGDVHFVLVLVEGLERARMLQLGGVPQRRIVGERGRERVVHRCALDGTLSVAVVDAARAVEDGLVVLYAVDLGDCVAAEYPRFHGRLGHWILITIAAASWYEILLKAYLETKTKKGSSL